jgi:hypothetical protein
VTDDQLERWWPALGTVVAEMRRAGQGAAADSLVDAVRAGSTSGEILGGVGTVLRAQRAFRSQLSDAAARSWDAVMADVDKAFPPAKPVNWTFTSRRRP